VNSKLRNAYADLQSAQSQILQQEKMASIGQLAAGIAHEINNPIGFIISNLGSLQKYINRVEAFMRMQAEAIEQLAADKPDANGVLEAINEHKRSLKLDYILEDSESLIKESLDGADRVKHIVQNLKNFSRIDETEIKESDINEGLESTINIVWNELKYKVTLHKDYGDIPLIKCNPGQMNQVFLNILINAAQAIDKHGEIFVKTWYDSGHVNISISDTGCGIPADKIDRIFEPFFTTKEVGKGTGLGLSIAYDIVKKHHGTIKVKSTVGEGSAFTIALPAGER
jgi:two-component system, NtrC family, sensor kinase